MNGRWSQEERNKKSGGSNGFYWGILFGIIAYYSSNPIIVWVCGILCFLQSVLPLALLFGALLVFCFCKIYDSLRWHFIKNEVKLAHAQFGKSDFRVVSVAPQVSSGFQKNDKPIELTGDDKRRLEELHDIARWAKEWKETQVLLAKLDNTPHEVVMRMGRKGVTG